MGKWEEAYARQKLESILHELCSWAGISLNIWYIIDVRIEFEDGSRTLEREGHQFLLSTIGAALWCAATISFIYSRISQIPAITKLKETWMEAKMRTYL